MFIIILVSFHFFLLLEALLNYSELISKIDKFHEVLRKISVKFCKMQDGSDANGHALLCAEITLLHYLNFYCCQVVILRFVLDPCQERFQN